jgi:hypothetical protein
MVTAFQSVKRSAADAMVRTSHGARVMERELWSDQVVVLVMSYPPRLLIFCQVAPILQGGIVCCPVACDGGDGRGGVGGAD